MEGGKKEGREGEGERGRERGKEMDRHRYVSGCTFA